MAWIKFKDPMGKEFSVPESVYKNSFAGNDAFTLVQDSKPAPQKAEEIVEKEIVEDEQISKPERNEDSNSKKGSRKVVS